MVSVSNLIIVEINPLPLFGVTGDVTVWGQARTKGIQYKAKRGAPVNRRTVKSRQNAGEPVGSLRKGTTAEYSRVGPLQFTIIAQSRASYSLYVIQGTKSPITAKTQARGADGRFLLGGRRKLYVPKGLGYGSRFASQVKGQKANDFLTRAVANEAAQHPGLGSWR